MDEWLNNILETTQIPETRSLISSDEQSVENIVEQFAPDDDTYNKWLDQLEGYVLRSTNTDLFLGDHTKYLDLRQPENPILRKGGMLIRYDDDTDNVTLRMGAYIWTIKTATSILFQKPGKQAQAVSLVKNE